MADSNSDHCGTSEPEPSDSLKTFGAVLQGFRENARITQEALAGDMGYSPHFVASVEQGRRLPSKEFVERAEQALDGLGVLRKAAKHLTRKQGLASWFRQWADLEQHAISLYTYECRLVPGLLQTEAYARTLFENQLPPLGDDQVEAQWTARAERQRLLWDRPNTAYSFLLEEHLFLRRMGGVEVTRELIDHVLGVAKQRNVEVQVMPLVRETHAGLDGPMQLLETAGNQWFAYNEGQRGGQFISDPKEISVLQMRYARMRSQALPLEDSVSLLQRTRGAL
ncbi:helix-turn-helix domain-containing protein [Streptomyces himalayensis]|uniref:Helix-turn-helix domain-containing protein n=1 Tax=Streptomyces himalayensis subsp. himalayensis TaxID=2756131 RepID=A0A7W0DN49_9ACTN|nr:helix-turn-helix transcriptional regulator [Streptomyces himalayensis]MBA2947775.1 helix-turn-helix domain-containing protein [Streptomyces himalayensis subsp. himalayensis]